MSIPSVIRAFTSSITLLLAAGIHWLPIAQTVDSSALPAVLVVTPRDTAFTEAILGISQELRGYARMEKLVLPPKPNSDSMTTVLVRVSPRMLVLVDNLSVSAYRHHLARTDSSEPVTPALILMAAQVEAEIPTIPNAMAISYEVPLVTSVLKVRTTLGMPVNRLGVLHREFMAASVADGAALCAREKTEVVGAVLPNRGRGAREHAVRRALRELLNERDIDALWIPNDAYLLSPAMLTRVWLPALRTHALPVVVGVEALVDTHIGLGTVAVLPDHRALGSQAGNIILDAMDADWKVAPGKILAPLTVRTVVSRTRARKAMRQTDAEFLKADKVVE